MSDGPIELYQPRDYTNLGVWSTGALQFKVYGLVAEAKNVSAEMQSMAKEFIEAQVLERVTSMGESNGLGFIIIHPGDLGISISAHWWVQGSVLCQHNYRKLYGRNESMDTITRPVVACIWELALINAEQEAWRRTMMGAAPDQAAHLEARPSFNAT